jgi:hypothetical protein
MNAKDAVVDDDRQRKKVKHIGEIGPHRRRAVLAMAFGVEAVRLGRCGTALSGSCLKGGGGGKKARALIGRRRRTCVTARLSWLPRMSCTLSGYRSFKHVRRLIVSTENKPRST